MFLPLEQFYFLHKDHCQLFYLLILYGPLLLNYKVYLHLNPVVKYKNGHRQYQLLIIVVHYHLLIVFHFLIIGQLWFHLKVFHLHHYLQLLLKVNHQYHHYLLFLFLILYELLNFLLLVQNHHLQLKLLPQHFLN